MEEFEELQRMLAEMVVWARSSTMCPFHQHITFYMMTPEGHVPWHGPICELPNEQQVVLAGQFVECEWQEEKKEIVDRAVEVMGGPDMSRYL